MEGLFEDGPEENTGEDVYSERYLDEYMEDDEINSGEEGFMIGYLG